MAVAGLDHDVCALPVDRQPQTTAQRLGPPGFAGLWLIPRLANFTSTRPDVDVRISVASPRSYFLLRSPGAARKPEVQEFAEWLQREALTASDPGSSGRTGPAPA